MSDINLQPLFPPRYSKENLNPIDWGNCGLIAYASGSCVHLSYARGNSLVHVSSIEIAPYAVSCFKFHLTLRAIAIADVKLQVEKMMKFSPEKVILGCTHYPYLLSVIKKFAPEDLFIDPAEIFVDYIKSDLEKNNLLNLIGGSESFYVSANPESFQEHSKIFYNVEKLPEVVFPQAVML